MPTSGKKSVKNEGDIWDKPKDDSITVRLTKEAKENFKQIAKSKKISTGELIERIARGIIPLKAELLEDREISDREFLNSRSKISPSVALEVLIYHFDNLSPGQIGRLLQSIAKWINHEKESNVILNMADISKRNIPSIILDAGIEWLHQETDIPIKRLNELVLGHLPERWELSDLASHIENLTLDELLEIVKRDFSNSGTSTDSMEVNNHDS